MFCSLEFRALEKGLGHSRHSVNIRKKPSYREVKKCVQGHTADEMLKWDLSPPCTIQPLKKQQADCLSEADPNVRIHVQVVY